MKIKSLTKLINDSTDDQILLFVKTCPDSTSMEDGIITASFQSVPIYIIQCCLQNKDSNQNEKNSDTKWFKLIDDIFDIESVNFIKNMPLTFQYLFDHFRCKWTHKLQNFLEQIDKQKKEIDNTEKVEVTDDGKIQLINCNQELIISTLTENKNNCLKSKIYSVGRAIVRTITRETY